MRRINILVVLLLGILSNAQAFFNTNNWSSPFGSGTGLYNNNPWGDNSNWNPFTTGTQFSPANDARNMAKYGATPASLKNYKQNPVYVPRDNTPMAYSARPSNWLSATDFSSTLENIKDTGSKAFYVNQPSFSQQFKNIQQESLKIDQAVREYMQQHSDGIYNKQGYALSPAAMSTSKVGQ